MAAIKSPALAYQLSISDVLVTTAFLVHLWLPFFALCVALLKGLNYVLLATKQVQWFIKQGRDHPLDALGIVGGTVVFVGAVAVQLFGSEIEDLTGHFITTTTN